MFCDEGAQEYGGPFDVRVCVTLAKNGKGQQKYMRTSDLGARPFRAVYAGRRQSTLGFVVIIREARNGPRVWVLLCSSDVGRK